MTMHAKWMWYALTEGIRTIKTFTKYEKCYCWWVYHKKAQEALSKMSRSLWQNKKK